MAVTVGNDMCSGFQHLHQFSPANADNVPFFLPKWALNYERDTSRLFSFEEPRFTAEAQGGFDLWDCCVT